MKKIPSVVSRMAKDRNFSLPASRYNGPDHPNAVAEMKALLSVARKARSVSARLFGNNWDEDLALERALSRLDKATRHD